MFLSRLLTAAALLCSVVLLPAQSPVPVLPAIRARVDELIAPDRASLATSPLLIGPLTQVPPGDSASSPEVTR
jgi:hypothetical protein